MTREEAIEQLQNCKGLIRQNGQDYLDERDFPLLDMAIEALERYDSEGCWENREHVQVDEDGYDIATCSICGSEITLEYPYDNYCPNCGTWMRGKVAWK